MMHLAHPILLMVGVIFFLPYGIRHRYAWQYSSLLLFPDRRQIGCGMLLSMGMTSGALILLLIALARPQKGLAYSHREMVARDIVLTLDLSLSMEGHILDRHDGAPAGRKLDVLQKAVFAFVKRHQHDRLGLIVFGDRPFGAWPLSSDSTTLSKRLETLPDLLPAELRGTNVGDALLKSLDHMAELAQSQTKIVVLLTDGLDSISPEVEEQIVRRIRRQRIKLYVLGIQLANHSSLMRLTRRVQGRYYGIDRAQALAQALHDIEQQEPSRIRIQHETRYQDLYPAFVLPGLGLWLGAMILKSFWVLEV